MIEYICMKQSNTFPHLIETLTDYGLTQKQASVYLTSLQLGAATVQSIAAAGKIERTNTYDAVKSLIERGLMGVLKQGKKKLYVAESPDVLESLLEEKRLALKRTLPQLRSFYNASDAKPRIQYYPGLEGYRTAYEETLDCQEKMLFGIYSVQDIITVLGKKYVDDMVDRRVKAGIFLKIMRSRETEMPGVYPGSEEEMREIRLAPLGMVFPIVTFVYDDKVIMLPSRKEPFGLIIESADIAQAHRNYFEALWQIGETVVS